MSKRTTNYVEPNNSKGNQQKVTKLKPGATGKFSFGNPLSARLTNQPSISNAQKRIAYDKNLKQQRLLKQQKLKQSRKIPEQTKEIIHVQTKEIQTSPNDEHKKLDQIKYPELDDYEQQVPKNTKNLRDFATMTSIQKQKQSRKSILKPSGDVFSRKSVHWSQISESADTPYINQIILANKQHANKQKKQNQERIKKAKIAKIKSDQSFLIDYFEINDVYDTSMVDIIGVIDEIDDTYAILLIKQKPTTPEPSYVKTRTTYEQESEFKKQSKQKKQVLAIGLIKKVGTHQHETNRLKKIQKDHPNIFAYVDIQDPQTLFFSSLPDDSVDGGSQKKERII